MKRISSLGLFFLLLQTTTHAAFWRCELPGGVYTVNTAAIASLSCHEYVVDGAARVTEVTIDTTGSVVARFYYIEAITPQTPGGIGQTLVDRAQERLNEVIQQSGQTNLWQKVVKSYPTSTHAHTVEYRLETKEQLTKILTSAERAWRNNQDATLKIQ